MAKSFPPILIAALRLLLGAVFVFSGTEKLMDLKYFGLIIAEYQLLPHFLIPVAALSASICELLFGLMLLLDFYSRTASAALLCMMAIFTAAMVNNELRGLDHECGCFELFSQWYGLKEEIGLGPIIRDILFFMLLLPVALKGSNRLPWVSSPPAAGE